MTAFVASTASVAGSTLNSPAAPAATYRAEGETANACPAAGSRVPIEIAGAAGSEVVTRNKPPLASLAITAPDVPARARPADTPGSAPTNVAAALVVTIWTPSSLSRTTTLEPVASTARAEPAVAYAPASAGEAGLATLRLRTPPRPSATWSVDPDSASRWALPDVSNVATCTGAEGVETSTTCTPAAPAAA